MMLFLLYFSQYQNLFAQTQINEILTSPAIKLRPLPVISYDPDNGLAYGASLTLLSYSKTFTQYDWKAFIHLAASTDFKTPFKTLEPSIEIDLASLELWGKSFRIKSTIQFILFPFVNYYGYGNTDNLTGFQFNESTNYVNFYQKISPSFSINLLIPILGSISKDGYIFGTIVGSSLEYYFITNSPKLPSGNYLSKISTDNPSGFTGGFLNPYQIGFFFDNRDYEPNPHQN